MIEKNYNNFFFENKIDKIPIEKRKVILGISGGVDSSVTLKILKDHSFEIIAVFLKMFDSVESEISCNDAKNLAKSFDVPFMIFNSSKIFDEKILSYFYKSYISGLTPSPCLVCNKDIKFFLLCEIMKKKNFNYIATGHYAKIKKIKINSYLKNFNYRNFKNNSEKFYSFISNASDESRDQSYFISSIPNKFLKKTLFPIGDFSKDFVRNLAKTFNLKISEKKDSQDLCFLSNNQKFGKNYKEFLLNYSKIKNIQLTEIPGLILNSSREKIGEHPGIHNFTIGQRSGLKVNSKNPLYVISIDKKNNQIIADEKKFLINRKIFINSVMIHPAVFDKKFCINNLEEYFENFNKNFIEISFTAYAKCRSKMEKTKVKVLIKKLQNSKNKLINKKIQIFFNNEESGIAAGQFCVISLICGAVIISGEILET